MRCFSYKWLGVKTSQSNKRLGHNQRQNSQLISNSHSPSHKKGQCLVKIFMYSKILFANLHNLRDKKSTTNACMYIRPWKEFLARANLDAHLLLPRDAAKNDTVEGRLINCTNSSPSVLNYNDNPFFIQYYAIKKSNGHSTNTEYRK